jgi:hypothetical protein
MELHMGLQQFPEAIDFLDKLLQSTALLPGDKSTSTNLLLSLPMDIVVNYGVCLASIGKLAHAEVFPIALCAKLQIFFAKLIQDSPAVYGDLFLCVAGETFLVKSHNKETYIAAKEHKSALKVLDELAKMNEAYDKPYLWLKQVGHPKRSVDNSRHSVPQSYTTLQGQSLPMRKVFFSFTF